MKNHTLFFRKLGKMSENLSSAAVTVVIGALRVNQYKICSFSPPLQALYNAVFVVNSNGPYYK